MISGGTCTSISLLHPSPATVYAARKKLILRSLAVASVAAALLCQNGGASTSSEAPGGAGSSRSQTFYVLRHGETDANASGKIQGSSNFSRLTEKGRRQAADVLQAFSQNKDGQQITIRSVYVSPLARSQETWEILLDASRQSQCPAEGSQIQEQCSRSQRGDLLRLPSSATTLGKLREIDFYDWEGMDKLELELKFPESWRAWEVGDPYSLKVLDSTTTTPAMQQQQQQQQQPPPTVERYPLLELWERADEVWDEILDMEQQNEYEALSERNAEGEAPEYEGLSSHSLIVAHGSLGQALLGTAMGFDATNFRRHEFPNCGLVEIQWEDDDDDDGNAPKQGATSSSSMDYIGTVGAKKEKRKLAKRWRWRWPATEATGWNYQ